MKLPKINKISLKNYKGIDNLDFSPNSINIIVGPNNTGKSSLLNGISLILYSLNGFRDNELTNTFNISNLSPLDYLIYGKKTESKISIDLRNNENSINHFDLEIFFSKEIPPNVNINQEAFSNHIYKQINEYTESEL